jgi:hypothetical protein
MASQQASKEELIHTVFETMHHQLNMVPSVLRGKRNRTQKQLDKLEATNPLAVLPDSTFTHTGQPIGSLKRQKVSTDLDYQKKFEQVDRVLRGLR